MLKEIHEQPRISKNLFSHYVKKGKLEFKDLKLNKKYLAALKKIFIFACGTAYHAGFAAKYFIEKYFRWKDGRKIDFENNLCCNYYSNNYSFDDCCNSVYFLIVNKLGNLILNSKLVSYTYESFV